MVAPTDGMPKKVYAVGDTIRLELTLLSTSNVKEVHAFYVREETSGYVHRPAHEPCEAWLLPR